MSMRLLSKTLKIVICVQSFDRYYNLKYYRPIQNVLHMMCRNMCIHKITKIMFSVKSGHYININTIADIILLSACSERVFSFISQI